MEKKAFYAEMHLLLKSYGFKRKGTTNYYLSGANDFNVLINLQGSVYGGMTYINYAFYLKADFPELPKYTDLYMHSFGSRLWTRVCSQKLIRDFKGTKGYTFIYRDYKTEEDERTAWESVREQMEQFILPVLQAKSKKDILKLLIGSGLVIEEYFQNYFDYHKRVLQ